MLRRARSCEAITSVVTDRFPAAFWAEAFAAAARRRSGQGRPRLDDE